MADTTAAAPTRVPSTKGKRWYAKNREAILLRMRRKYAERAAAGIEQRLAARSKAAAERARVRLAAMEMGLPQQQVKPINRDDEGVSDEAQASQAQTDERACNGRANDAAQ